MVIGKGIAKRDRPLMAHHMIARRDQNEPVFRKRKGLKFFSGIDLVPDNADLGKVLGDGAHNLAAGTLLQIDVDLRLFLMVVEAASITLGAARAGMALASASERIRLMEDSLGAPLLERNRRGVRATPAGSALVHHAQLVIQQLDSAREPRWTMLLFDVSHPPDKRQHLQH